MWQNLINDLTKRVSQVELIEELKRCGVLTSQANISRLKNGVIAEPKYALGNALIEVHRRILKK